MEKKRTKKWGLILCVVGFVVLLIFGYPAFSAGGFFRQASKKIKVSGISPFDYWETQQGTKVFFARNAEIPMVDLQIQFYAGCAYDENKPGLARLTTLLLDEGVGVLEGQDIAEQFESVGAEYRVFTTADTAGIRLRILNDPYVLKNMTDLVSQLVSMPTFPESAVQRVRNNTMTLLEQEKQDPSRIAKRAFLKAIYPNHPYGRLPLGTHAGVESIQRADIVQFHRKYFNANNMIVTLVGSLSRQEAKKITDKIIEKIPSGEKAVFLPEVQTVVGSEHRHVSYPATQVHILMGMPAIAFDHPDYLALEVGNFILGSPFVSRLFQAIREKEGLAYAPYTQLVGMKAKGPFIAGLQTKSASKEKALAILKKTVETFLEQGPSEKELQLAKLHLMGAFPLKMSSNEKILQQLSRVNFFNLPENYLATYQDKIQALSCAEIKAALNRHLNKDAMMIVTVGSESL